MRPLLVAAALAALAAPAAAEMWGPLNDSVRRCGLIVRAKAMVPEKGDVRFEILESWKGAWDASEFLAGRIDRAGRYLPPPGEHGADVVDGQEIVLFFPRPKDGEKYGPHSTALPVVKGRVLYASTSDDEELRRWWGVEELEKRVRALSLPMATSEDLRLQCVAIERAGSRVTLRFLVDPKPAPWHPTRYLLAQDGVRVAKGPFRPVSSWTNATGEIEIRGRTDAASLDGLVVECDLVRVTKLQWRRLEEVGPGKSGPLVAGPYRIHVDGEKNAATVVFELDRDRPIRALDGRWLFDALHLCDRDFRRLRTTDVACNHRAGAARYALEAGDAPAYPLSLAVPVPTEVTRDRVRLGFPRLPFR